MTSTLTAATRILYWSAMAILVVVAVESILWGLTSVSASVRSVLVPGSAAPTTAMYFDDPELGYRPNPAYPEHDDWGFRNAQVPETADVVVFGDSQTYGHGVPPEAAWPRVMGRQLGRVVYSMAFNGYGPTQSLLQLDQALELKPAVVVEAFYAGNDLFDCWDAVHVRSVSLGLAEADAATLVAMQRAEEGEALRARIDRLFVWQDVPGEQAAFSLRGFLRRYSRVYGLLRATRLTLLGADDGREWERLRRVAAGSAGHDMAFEDPLFRTVLTPAYRLCALDLDDPRIAEGQRIALAALKALAQRARAAGARPVLVWIPTKEQVFSARVALHGSVPNDSYARQLESEARLKAAIRASCGELGVEWIDVEPALKACLEQGLQPYPISQDGHPNAVGQQAIARQVGDGLGL